MYRSRLFSAACVFAIAFVCQSATLHAQQAPALAVAVDPQDYRALVSLGPILADHDLREAALSGLPVRVRVKTELWKDRFFDALVGSTSWSAVLVYEPLRERFLVRVVDARGPARSVANYEAARALVEGELPLRLRPTAPGRYYYTATLEIETLSVSDLQELERWLQGELQPAVAGDQSIPGAIGAGAKRLLIRVLGVPARRIDARSGQFLVPAR